MLASELVDDPSILDRRAGSPWSPAGFSYADSLGAGRMLALDLAVGVGEELRSFVAAGRPLIGICNGFQVLTRAGLLPGALGHNAAGTFDCRWVELEPVSRRRCACGPAGSTTTSTARSRTARAATSTPIPTALAAAGQVALRYAGSNPNGSVADIAGVCDTTGLVLGLMPHPENHIVARQHPRHGRGAGQVDDRHLGLHLFANGVTPRP